MESIRDIYIRFIENYRTPNGGINLYPQFDSDLEVLLEWLEGDEVMYEWTPDGIYLPDNAEYDEVDCTWRPVEGGIDE